MVGTRRGNDRKQQSDAFEAANPFLTRVDYEIGVTRGEPELHFGGGLGNQIVQQVVLLEEELLPVIPEVTEDGVPVDSFPLDYFPTNPEESAMDALFTPAGFMFPFDPEADDAPSFLFGGDESVIVMTDYGFGVNSEAEFFDSIEDLDEEDFEGENGFPDLPPENFALDDEEILFFFVGQDELPFPGPGGPGGPGLNTLVEEYEYPMGAARIAIDYMAVGGSGEVFVFYGGEFLEGEVTSGPVSNGGSGQVEAWATNDGLIEGFVIGVTGSLEVVINTVGITTNFAGGPVDPFFGEN